MQTIRIAHDRVTLPPESVPGFLHTETVGGEFVVQGIECRRIGQPHRKTESSLTASAMSDTANSEGVDLRSAHGSSQPRVVLDELRIYERPEPFIRSVNEAEASGSDVSLPIRDFTAPTTFSARA